MEAFYLVKNITFFIIGLIIGELIPDLDQKTKYLSHRSKLTHLPFIHLILAYELNDDAMRGGILMGYIIHIILDLFPKKWKGYSTIKPFGRSTTIALMALSIIVVTTAMVLASKVNLIISIVMFMIKIRNERHRMVGKVIVFLTILIICLETTPKIYF